MLDAVTCDVRHAGWGLLALGKMQTDPCTPNLPTRIIPTKIPLLKITGEFPRDMRIPPLRIKILLESNPPKSGILVRRFAVSVERGRGSEKGLQRYTHTEVHIRMSF